MNKYIYCGITTVIILALGASWTIKKASSSHSLKNIKQVPNFSLINQNGDSFTEKKLKNKSQTKGSSHPLGTVDPVGRCERAAGGGGVAAARGVIARAPQQQ